MFWWACWRARRWADLLSVEGEAGAVDRPAPAGWAAMKISTQEAFDFRVIAAVADTLFPSLEADAADAEELSSGNAFHKGGEIATFMQTSAASPTVVKEVGPGSAATSR